MHFHSDKLWITGLSKDTPPRLILEIDVGKLLTVVIAHGEARFLFFDVHGGGKRRSVTAFCHIAMPMAR